MYVSLLFTQARAYINIHGGRERFVNHFFFLVYFEGCYRVRQYTVNITTPLFHLLNRRIVINIGYGMSAHRHEQSTTGDAYELA